MYNAANTPGKPEPGRVLIVLIVVVSIVFACSFVYGLIYLILG